MGQEAVPLEEAVNPPDQQHRSGSSDNMDFYMQFHWSSLEEKDSVSGSHDSSAG